MDDTCRDISAALRFTEWIIDQEARREPQYQDYISYVASRSRADAEQAERICEYDKALHMRMIQAAAMSLLIKSMYNCDIQVEICFNPQKINPDGRVVNIPITFSPTLN